MPTPLKTATLFIAATVALSACAEDPSSAPTEPGRSALAPAAVGDLVATVSLPVSGADVGVAFDGTRIYYSDGTTDLISFEPADPFGTLLSVPVTSATTAAALDLDAMAYDVTRDVIWAVEHATENVYQVDKSTGVATFQFSATGKCTRCVGDLKDGLAFDAGDPGTSTDDAIWWSYDVDFDVYKLDLTGATIESFSVNTGPLNVIFISSGIAVGGDNLYLGNNGLNEIYRVDKQTKTLVDMFTETDLRPEDMECDPVTFAPTEVMWVRQFSDPDHVFAFEIESGSCGLGGTSGSGPIGITVEIDIKPDGTPNSINVRSKKGVTPVAILGSETLDVMEIDVTTLSFGPSGASPAHDLSHPDVLAGHLEDVDQDGFVDLVTHYWTMETGIDVGDTEACISGETLGGTPFSGCDSVRIVGKGR